MRHHMLETEIITSSKMFHSWKTLMILISVGVLIIVIAGVLTAVFIYKNRELQNKKSRIKSEKWRTEEVIPRLRKSAVNVTLDPDSAHPRLIVSDDGKQVRYEKPSETVTNRDEEPNDKYDEELCVLGKEGFSSDFYYEVQVKGLNAWCVGVARESVNRKGLIRLSPVNGYWTVGLEDKGEDGVYWTCGDPDNPVSLNVKPQRVGVFVDYKKCRVHFYDMTFMCHIYSYTGQSFTEKLHPSFSFGHFTYELENSPPLIICSDLS